MRLIDADDLDFLPDDKNVMNGVMFVVNKRGGGRTLALVQTTLKAMIDRAPTIDAAPVVQARWVKAHGMMPPEYHHRKQCSLCGGWALQDYFGRERMSHYCPNCGAKMYGGSE